MSELQLRFFPWLRRGLARSIQAGADGFATINFSFTVGGAPVEKTLRMRGPGDVVGISPAQVIRVEPRAGTIDFEPNYFPLIEFSTPDLPWMFTPTAPDGERLLPWFTLVTVKEDAASIGLVTGAKLPILTAPRSELPGDLNEMWAWAHVQTTSRYATGKLSQALRDNPDAFISRVISPRNLEPLTSYVACLVPTYEAGVLAGLGSVVPDDIGEALAWTPDDTRSEIQLPVYYSWSFRTGTLGDFELLVERLQPSELDETVGRRDLDLTHSGIPEPKGLPLPDSTLFYGALVSPTAIVETGGGGRVAIPPVIDPKDPDIPKTPTVEPLRNALYDFLTPEVTDHTGGYDYRVDDPVVTPPHYGREQLSGAALPPPKPSNLPALPLYQPVWYSNLNSHPRTRGAAGLGARVVRKHQEDFMARAWESVTAIRSVNQTLQQGIYASLVAGQLSRRVEQLDAGALFAATRNAHQRFLPQGDGKTIWGQLREADVPDGAISGDLQRITRSGGVVYHALKIATQGTGIQRELRLIPVEHPARLVTLSEYKMPTGSVTLQTIEEPEAGGGTAGNWYADALAGEVKRELANLDGLLGGGVPAADGVVKAVLNANRLADGHIEQVDRLVQQGYTKDSALTATRRSAVALRDLTAQYIDHVNGGKLPAQRQLQTIRSRVQDLQASLEDWSHVGYGGGIELPPVVVAATLEPIADALSSALDPVGKISAHLQARITLADGSWGSRAIPMRLTAAPIFDEAVYPYVCELSPEYMLPGVGMIVPNTVGLVQVNGEYIESLLVGMNHEMSREMRWREYPAMLNGTWFHHFWTETVADINAINTWAATTALGDNLVNFTDNMLVLLIKGDIFRRYPNLAVYTLKAVAQDVTIGNVAQRMRIPEEPEVPIFPAFSGELDGGVRFFGFADLTPEAALGTATSENHLSDGGYFFVLQEQPTEPRFGLDEAVGGKPVDQDDLATWSELSWAHLMTDPDPEAPDYLLIAGQFTDNPKKPDTTETGSPSSTWGSNAGEMARIVLQRPVRMLVHASVMLPDESVS